MGAYELALAANPAVRLNKRLRALAKRQRTSTRAASPFAANYPAARGLQAFVKHCVSTRNERPPVAPVDGQV